MKETEGELGLGQEMAPGGKEEVGVSTGEASNEVVFVGLNGSFSIILMKNV